MPGWCSHCGWFLGDAEAAPASPEEMWIARQVGDWIADQSALETTPSKEAVRAALETIILKLDGGRYGSFARRLRKWGRTRLSNLNIVSAPFLLPFILPGHELSTVSWRRLP